MTASLESQEVDSRTLEAWSIHLGRRVGDPLALRRRLSAGTLPAAFAAAAARRPDRPALELAEGGITHGALDREGAAAASLFLRLGAGPGRPVLLVATTSLPTVVAYLGILRSGAPAVLASPSLTAVELIDLARRSGAGLGVGRGEQLDWLAGSPLQELVGLDREDSGRVSAVLGGYELDPAPLPRLDPAAPAILAFTSATTGVAKAVPLSHRNLLSSIRGVMRAWRWSAADRLVHALPLAHQHGLGGVHATLLSGSWARFLDRFDPARLLDAIETSNPSVLFAVPTMYRRLIDQGHDLSILGRLRLFTSGSAALPEELGRELASRVGVAPLERYGTTESGLDVSNPYSRPRVPGTVGLPLPGVEVALVEGDRPVARGEVGEVLIRGPQVFSGYAERTGEDPFLFDWFRTGDLGTIEPGRGHLVLVGRSKEMIVSGGFNVYPKEVEAVLVAIPGVDDAAVVGLPSSEWGEEVVAFVVSSGVSEAALAEAVITRLAPYKRPKRVLTVDQIPRNEVGKVQLQALRQLGMVAGRRPLGI